MIVFDSKLFDTEVSDLQLFDTEVCYQKLFEASDFSSRQDGDPQSPPRASESPPRASECPPPGPHSGGSASTACRPPSPPGDMGVRAGLARTPARPGESNPRDRRPPRVEQAVQ